MADKPVTREEKYLAYLTGDYTGEIPKPITRKEKYLYELCLKGMGGEISPEEIKAAVNEYLEKNPVKPGATTEQAQQIEQNKKDVASLKEDIGTLVNGTQEVITIPDTIGHVTNYSGYSQEITKVKAGEKWVVLFNTFSSAVSIRNMSNVSDSWNGVSSPMDTKKNV